MIRAVRIDLGHLTEKKRRMIREICVQYRAAVNFYIRKFWRGENPRWNALLPHTRLSARYVSCAHHQARAIVHTARRAKTKTMPVFRGRPILDGRFIEHKPCDLKEFDRLLLLSTLKKGERMAIPYKTHERLNYWLSQPGAHLKPGCALSEHDLILWVEIPDPRTRADGDSVGLDLGYNHLVALSDGKLIGDGIKKICQKTSRKKPGSKAMLRARRERENYIGYVLNRLPWNRWSVLVIESLKNLKHGKRKNRSKAFRKALSPWVYRQVIERLRHKAQENGVLLVEVDPRDTSRTCPVCGTARKENRKGEMFRCVSCGHTAQADLVGAANILRKYLSDSVRSQCPGCPEVLADSSGLLEAAGNSGGDTPGRLRVGEQLHLKTAGNSREDALCLEQSTFVLSTTSKI